MIMTRFSPIEKSDVLFVPETFLCFVPDAKPDDPDI